MSIKEDRLRYGDFTDFLVTVLVLCFQGIFLFRNYELSVQCNDQCNLLEVKCLTDCESGDEAEGLKLRLFS